MIVDDIDFVFYTKFDSPFNVGEYRFVFGDGSTYLLKHNFSQSELIKKLDGIINYPNDKYKAFYIECFTNSSSSFLVFKYIAYLDYWSAHDVHNIKGVHNIKQIAHFTIPYEATKYYDALAKKMIMLQ